MSERMGTCWFMLLCICTVQLVPVLGQGAPQGAGDSAMGPLRVCSANPRYFADLAGRPVYLTGSHTWQNLQDGVLSNYTAVTQPFDFTGYLTLLRTHHHNFIRLWRWELTSHEPQPWMRTGPGLALDGNPKFDLRQFNPAYFDRLRSRVIAARDLGMYVSVMLFEDWIFMSQRPDHPLEQHPFHRDNNASGVDGDQNRDGWGIEIHTLQVPEVLEVQKAYVRRVIETVNDLDNVLYEVCNEGLRHTRDWQYEMVRFVKRVQSELPQQHPVGMTSVGDMNEDCLHSPADWTSFGTTGWDQRDDRWTSDPPAAEGHKVCLLDTDHIGWKVFIDDAAFTRAWVWKSFTRGHNTLLMENLADAPGWIAGRTAMGHTRRLADRLDLAAMVPHPELASTRYCLADPGRAYVVYLPDGGEVTLDLSATTGRFEVEWVHPAQGSSQPADPVAGGGLCLFEAPFPGDAALYVRPQGRGLPNPSAADADTEGESAQLAIARLIRAAGSTENELERLGLLRQLEARGDLDPVMRADLVRLLPVVDDWANGKSSPVIDTGRAAENGYLCRFITSRTRPAADGPVHPPELSGDSLLRPIWCFYRGRMLIWQVIQSGPLLRVKETRERYFGEGRRLLEETREAFPDNRVVRMYLGEPIPWPTPAAADPGAPAWANLQREGLEKLADVIHWWIAQRQLPDGQFGGGWGDDVEMWRWWSPVLIAFDDPAAAAAQERLSSGIFRLPHLAAGFTSRVTDVEHSNEDTTDTILPMMHLRPDDPVWKARALRLAELTRDRWTGRNKRGFLQFKSIYFSVDKVDATAGRAFDTVYHPSVIQPALLYWQRAGDPGLAELFGDWLQVWVDAAARSENGKPAGVLPSAIRWPDGGIAKIEQPWWEPFSPGHNDALYNWPGATRLMTSTLLLAQHMTGEEKYFEPIRSMAALRLKHVKSPDGEPGSEAWCAHRMSGFLADALAKRRWLTGDPTYDALLRADASGYVRYRLTGDRAPLESVLRRNAEAFRSNWEAYTSEMRWTDRVMSFTRNFLNYLPAAAPPSPSPEVLYSTATGDPGQPLVFPLNAVRWRTPPRDLAALVVESSRTTFAAELYHFGDQPRALQAELFLLLPGEYDMTLAALGEGGESVVQRRAFRVEGPRTLLGLELPARRSCLLKVAARPKAAARRLEEEGV